MEPERTVDIPLSSPIVIVSLFITGVVSLTVWASPEPTSVPRPNDSAEVAEGRALYTRYCALCHGANGEGHAADHAPALTNQEFLRIATDDFLTASILEGRADTPMSAFSRRVGGPLGDEDVAKVIAFLRSHQVAPTMELVDDRVAGNIARGSLLFSEHCAECHVPGGVDTKGPRLDHPQFLALASDAYILRSIRVGRPGTPMKAWESVLRRDQVRDLVAAIRSRDTEARHRETGHHHAERERAPSHDLGPDPIVTLWESVSDETLAVGEATARGPAFDLEGRWYVSARQLRAALSAGRRMILLDARPMSDWLTGHLPGALPVPFYADPETIERIPTDGTQVVIYCGCPHAAADRVAHRLKDRGVTNVAVLNEGFWHWKDNGYPVVTGESRY